MDADWSRVRIVPAAPDDKVYGNPGFRGLMYTAGSATVTGYWDVARTFGAQVRRGVVGKAAAQMGAPPPGLSTQAGEEGDAATRGPLRCRASSALSEAPPAAPP